MPMAAGLYYFSYESEDASRPPVILIHGAGGTHLNWPPQLRRLHGQRIFAVDLPGHGKSEGVGRQVIAEYAADVLRFMDALKLPAAVFVGHSMGSAVALTLALTEPERALGLGLLGAGARLRVAPAVLEAAPKPDMFLVAVNMVNDACYSPQADARLRELGAQKMAETRPPVFYGDFLACDAFNVLNDLPRIHTPTLILVGGEDKLTPPRFSEALHDRIPKARLHILAGAGHMVMQERPDECAALLTDFLDGIPYQPGK